VSGDDSLVSSDNGGGEFVNAWTWLGPATLASAAAAAFSRLHCNSLAFSMHWLFALASGIARCAMDSQYLAFAFAEPHLARYGSHKGMHFAQGQ